VCIYTILANPKHVKVLQLKALMTVQAEAELAPETYHTREGA